jgi:hypothetical protein
MAWPAEPCDGKVVLSSMPIYPPHFRRWGHYHVGPMAPPAKSCDRKVVVVIFVMKRVIGVELRHRRRMLHDKRLRLW